VQWFHGSKTFILLRLETRTESHCMIRGISCFQRDVFLFLILIIKNVLSIEK